MKILKLTLSKLPFETMISGIKKKEYRRASPWIISRLLNKDGSPKEYDLVQFKNGYSRFAPTFTVEFKGFEINEQLHGIKYCTGLFVMVEKGMYVINLGELIGHRNIPKAYTIESA